MKNTQEQIRTMQEQTMKALAGLLPEDAQNEVGTSVSKFLEAAVAELHEEMETQLKEAYAEHEQELNEAEKVAEEGYGQAWETITDLRDRLELQKEEFEETLEENYEQAYQMLVEERAKNDTLEVDLYEEYNKKFEDIKTFMVDKVDQFLQLQARKYQENAKRDVINDPNVLEHKLAFEKILEVAADYIADEDYAMAASSKVENINKQLDETKGQLKILESKNMRLSMENTKLNEAVRQTQELINEQVTKGDKKARVEKARIVEGRGNTEPDAKRQKVIAEYNTEEPVAEQNVDHFAEKVGENVFADWHKLAGLTEEK